MVVANIALGANAVRKHFTFQSLMGGVDSVFSIEPRELACLIIQVKRDWKVHYGLMFAKKILRFSASSLLRPT